MVSAEKFWDGMAERYAARPISDTASYDATLERVAAYLGPRDRVLELGAGTGTTAIRLAPLVADYKATDLSANLLEIARKRAGEAEADLDHLHFVKAAVEDDPGAEAYDAVMAFNLLHLFDDPGAALRHMARAVKPGGVVISKSACLKDGMGWVRPIIWAMRLIGKAPRVRFMSAAELDGMVEAAGLTIVETGWYSRKACARFVVARKPA